MIGIGNNTDIRITLGTSDVEIYLGVEKIYPNTQPTPSYEQYLTFKAIDDGTTFQFSQTGLEYSVDGGTTWNSLEALTDTPSLNTGAKIMFKGNMSIIQNSGIGMFYSNGHFNVEGNPLSLVDDTNFADITDLTDKNFIFYRLFKNTDVVNASNLALPATTLAEQCYLQMFQGCTSLTSAPVLPATTLAQSCYSSMFYGCTSLVNAPVLSATILADYCCDNMFYGCTALTTAPQLTATTLAQECYASMFGNCTNLRTAPNLPATTLVSGCYRQMFYGCTALTTAPALPATTLVDRCYVGMFNGCTSLTTAPALPATTLVDSCYYSMFSGCTSLTTAPVLPATTLVRNCYYQMFKGCTSLNYIKAMFTTTPSASYTYNWVNGVSATGTFVKNSEATWNVTGVHGVPTGWTVEIEHAKINKKYRATYTNSTTVDGECDGNNLVINEVTKSGLKTVVIGECVPAIVGECFADCADLTSVIIEGNTSIDSYSFARNNGHLTSITMYSTTPPPCQSTAFTYYKSGTGYVPMTSITIYVPAASVNLYKNASGWSTYSTKIRAIS